MSPHWLRRLILCAPVVCLPLSASQPREKVNLTLSNGRSFTNGVGMKFVRVPKGKFLMGATANDKAASQEERPQHEVEITKDFYLGVYEVTQRQYREVTGTDNSSYRKDGSEKEAVRGIDTDDFPAENVSWNDAQDFLKKLNALPTEASRRGRYRLPTEAEWEYACRAGGRDQPFHTGDVLTVKDANFASRRTCKVGSYRPNAWGLHDMHGNVWEWCADWYDSGEYARPRRADPKGPENGTSRCIRGGGRDTDPRYCRSSQRGSNTLVYRGNFNGFRVACGVGRD